MLFQRTARLSALLALLAGCAAPPAGEPAPAAEPGMTVRGSLAFRENVAPPPGSVATIVLREFGDDASAPVAATTRELERAQNLLPFELRAAISALEPGRQYAVSARVTAPDAGTEWTTDVAQLIDITQREIEIGVLLMTPSRPHVRRDFD